MIKKIYSQEELLLYWEEYQNGLSLEKIANKYNLNRHTLSKRFKEANFSIRKNGRKYSLNEEYFQEINSSEKAYWLGFIAADGAILSTGNDPEPKVLSFNLNIRDAEHLEKFCKSIESEAKVIQKEGTGFGKHTSIAHLEINSKQLVKDLQKYGIHKRKSLILKPPSLKEEFIIDWIRGYLDGDGSISILSNGTFSLSFVGTKEVLDFIAKTLTPEKDKKLYQPTLNKNNYELSYGGTIQVVKLLHLIYDNSNTFLDRKYSKALEIYSRFEK